MKFVMVLAALVLSVGCTKTQVQQDVNTVACSLEGSVESLVSATVASQLACSNLTAVQADVAAEVSKLKICTAATPAPALTGGKLKGPVGDVVCAPVVAALMGGVLFKNPNRMGLHGRSGFGSGSSGNPCSLSKSTVSISMVVIGDVHGTYRTLRKLLKEFPNDPICLVGDLVDRGPASVDVVQFVMDNYDRIKCVKGNHEVMMLDFYKNGGRASMGDIWLHNGGKKVYEAYKYKYGSNKLATHIDFLEKLPFYLEFPEVKNDEGQYLLVSHSIAINADLERCAQSESLIWGRDFPDKDPSNGKWYNVFGHTPTPTPIVTDWYANIDTGCCFGDTHPAYGHLTALKFPELELVMVKKDEAEPPAPQPSP